MTYQPWQSNYGYQNPYMNNLAQFQPQQQNFIQPQQQFQSQQNILSGEYVDGLDVVKAKNVDLSGKVVFYPKADLTEVYTKQLRADGTSQINTYRLVPAAENTPVQAQNTPRIDDLSKSIESLRQDVLSGFSGIKALVETQMSSPENAPTPTRNQRGGSQK